jgi:prepilin peptidase CpaA
MPLLSLALRLLALCMLFALAVTDVRSRRLPTGQVLVIGALFFIDAFVRRMPAGDVMMHIAIALAVFAVCALLFALNMLGGGDAKLAAAIFLWAGTALSLPAFIFISIAGMFVSLLSLATRYLRPRHDARVVRGLAMFSSARGVPYGVALAAGGGVVIVLPALLSLTSVR